MRRPHLALVVALGVLVAASLAWNPAMAGWVERHDAALARDPASGVVLGAEAVDLGDPTAASACLLVHGYAGSRKDFSDLGQRLAEAGLFVRLLRLPGHGTTVEDLGRQTPESLLQGASQELHALQGRFQAVSLVGFSMGGAISTLLASQEPIARLVLLAPYYRITYHWYYLLPVELWSRLLHPLVWAVPKSKRSVKLNRRENVDELFANPALPTASVITLTELGRRARDPAVLAAIQAPVRVFHSPSDGAASFRASYAAYQLLGSQDKGFFRMDARDNHHLLWDWDAEEVKQQVVEFLAAPAAG